MTFEITQETLEKLKTITAEDLNNVSSLLSTKTEGNLRELVRANQIFTILSNLLKEVADNEKD